MTQPTPPGPPGKTTFAEALSAVPSPLLLDFARNAVATPPYMPAALWLSRVFIREVEQRVGRPGDVIPPLVLSEHELGPSLAWLDTTATALVGQGVIGRAAPLVAIGAMLHLLHELLAQRAGLVALH